MKKCLCFVMVAAFRLGFAEETCFGNQFDELIEQTLSEMNVPGAAVGVIKDGEVLFAKGYGLRNVELILPVTTKTQFQIGSTTKSFTTFLLGRLVDEGVLHWDDPIADHIPYFKLKDPYTTYQITIRDYLTHNSGYSRHDGIWFNETYPRKDVIHKLRYIDPIRPFRTDFLYQNIGYMVAAHAAEVTTGKTYEELLFEKVLNPIGFQDANFSLEKMKASKDYSEGHRETNKQVFSTPHIDISTIAAAGGLNAHLEDMLLWLKTLLNQGDGLLEKSTWNELISPQTVSNLFCNGSYGIENEVLMESYGLGWFVISYRNHLCVLHGGNLEGFSSAILFFPRENLGVVVLCNKNLTPLPYILSTVICDCLLDLPDAGWLQKYRQFSNYDRDALEKTYDKNMVCHQEHAEPSHPLPDYQGIYTHPGYGDVTISAKKNILEVVFNHMAMPLNHWHYDVFEVSDVCDIHFLKGMKLTFHENVYGDIHTVAIPFDPLAEDIVFVKQKDRKLFKDDYLDHFIGNYNYHGVGFQIERVDNGLVVKAFGQPSYILLPERDSLFSVKDQDYKVQFILNESGDAISVQLIQGSSTLFTAHRV